MYDHLLVALDGSVHGERVLEHAEALATAFGSTITLLRASVSAEEVLVQTAGTAPSAGDIATTLDPTPIVESDHEAANDYLRALQGRLKQSSVTVNIETPAGPAAEEIVERARALGTDLILMTTHGRSGLGRIVFGSVADAV